MKRISFAIALLAIVCLAPLVAQSLEADLQRAIQKETATGDLKAAISEYQKIVARAAANKAVAAQALIRMADAHRKLGAAEAKKIYERVLREFPDQKDAVAHARAALGGLAAPSSSVRATRQLWVDAQGAGAVSSDGRYLSHTDRETGDLAIRDLHAGSSRRLTNIGGWTSSGDYVEWSAVSPDGRQVAYFWYNGKASAYEVRLIPTFGEAPRPRTLIALEPRAWLDQPSWTPDGAYIVAARSTGNPEKNVEEIVTVSVADGAVRVVVSGTDLSGVSVSPDGRYVAYNTRANLEAGTQRDICIVPRDGSRAPARAAHHADDYSPLWSPDGTRVLFLSDRSGTVGLWSMPFSAGALGAQASLVDASIVYPISIARNGALYYRVGGDHHNVYVAPISAELKTSGAASAFSDKFVNAASGGAWSIDGKYFAYYAAPGTGLNAARSVVIRNVQTGHEREVRSSISLSTAPAAGIRWFPDGSSLLVVGRDASIGDSPGFGLYRMNVADGSAALLARTTATAPSGSHPALTDDGQMLYYIDRINRQNQVVQLDVRTGTKRELPITGITAVAVSHDGKRLAYVGNLSPGSRLAVVELKGGDERTLFESSTWTEGSRFGTVAWSRDDKHIFFVLPAEKGQRGSVLWRVPVAGGSPAPTGISSSGRIKFPEEMPGGGRLAYSVVYEGRPELWVLENFLPSNTVSKK